MDTPLNASATTAGALLSESTFEVPPFQREYAWKKEDVENFWSDLSDSIGKETYFLGLVILTDENGSKHVVDGQQRLITLTLLASAIFHEANSLGRKALADRIQADFLKSINYETDEIEPRLILSDTKDNKALDIILNTGDITTLKNDKSASYIVESYAFIQAELKKSIVKDPFKQLGLWADFITKKLYFAVFIHPDPASAYQVFEVINTRGVELTTADLLKNYILSQVSPAEREDLYDTWRMLATQIEAVSEQSFVQYIRHVVTSYRGHILPKDLFDFLAQRKTFGSKQPLLPNELIQELNNNLDLYIQMMDPKQGGPAEPEALKIFTSLNALSVISVRPLLLSIAQTPNSIEGMYYVLQLVVRRIVVGTLGTGNVERRLGEAAKLIREEGDWTVIINEFQDLNPSEEMFINQLENRSFNKRILSFLRHSIIEKSKTPEINGVLHQICPKGTTWPGFDDAEAAYYLTGLGNSFLTKDGRRDPHANTWDGFKESMLHKGIDGEIKEDLLVYEKWGADELKEVIQTLSRTATDVWY